MAHAERCPVCEGKGKVESQPCHGCFGLGWVSIYDQTAPIVPMPYPNPWWMNPYPWYPTWISPVWSGPIVDDNTGTYTIKDTGQWSYTTQ